MQFFFRNILQVARKKKKDMENRKEGKGMQRQSEAAAIKNEVEKSSGNQKKLCDCSLATLQRIE